MPMYRVFATITAGHYCGDIEASDEAEAQGLAEDKYMGAQVTICHQCAREMDEPTISKIDVELAE